MKQKYYSILLLISFLLITSNLNSQVISMVQTNGPDGGDAKSMISCKDGSLLASFNYHIYRSTDYGGSWKNTNLPFNGTLFLNPQGDNIFVGDLNGVIRRSSDNGRTWDSLKIKGLGANNVDSKVKKLSFDSLGNIYTVLLRNSLYKSTDNGNNWSKLSTVPANQSGYNLRITGQNTFLYSADTCLYRSTDNGINWIMVTNGLPKANINWGYIELEENRFFITKDRTIFAKLINNQYYCSTDDGITWAKYSIPTIGDYFVLNYDFAGTLWCFSYDQVYNSKDNGKSWTKIGNINNKPFSYTQEYFAIPNGTLFASESGLWRSLNNGISWSISTNGVKEAPATNVAIDKNGVFYAVSYRKLYKSENKGGTWDIINNGKDIGLNGLKIDNNNIFYSYDNSNIYISRDQGKTWIKSNLGNPNVSIRSFSADGSGRILVATTGGAYLSTDFGDSWKRISVMNNEYLATNTENRKGEIFQCFSKTINRSSNNGLTWENLTTYTADWPVIFISRKGTVLVGFNSSIYYSDHDMIISYNNGASWKKVLAGKDKDNAPAAINGFIEDASGNIYAYNSNDAFVSTNNGNTWNKYNLNLNDGVAPENNYISTMIFDGNGYLYAASNYGVYASTEPLLKILPPVIYTTSAADGKATLKWSKNKSQNFSNYAIYGSSEHYPSEVIKETTGGVNDTVITISGLTNNKPYYLVVSAIDKSGNEAFSDEFSVTPYPLPDKPVLSIIADKSQNSPINLSFRWTKANYTDLYTFHLSQDSTFSSLVINDTTMTDTVKQVSGLQNLTKYFWRVRGKNNVGYGQWSDTWQFTTIIAAPASPTAALPVNNAVNQPVNQTFKWTRSARSEQYHLQLSKDQAFSSYSYNDSTLTDTLKTLDLSNGTKYYWRVRGKNIGGVSPWSETSVLTTIVAAPENAELAYPGDLAVNIRPDVTLRWNTSPRAEKYIVQISQDSLFKDIAQIDSSVADTMKKVNPLVYDMKYYWRVKARNIGGESNWSKAWSFKTVIAVPDFPYLNVPVNNSVNQAVTPVLKWQKLKDAEKYQLQISSTVDFSSIVINDSLLTDTLKQAVSLKNNISYYWRVRASNIGGFGPWSEVWTFKTIVALPSVPVLVSPADGSKNQPTDVKLSWNSVPDAEKYRLTLFYIEQKGAATVMYQILRDTALADTYKAVSALKSGSRYKWQVSAVNAAGAGDTAYAGFITLLPAPSSLTASANELRKVKLSWTEKTDNELGFILERKRQDDAGYKTIDTLKANTVSYTDSTVMLASTYIYRMKAYTEAAVSDYTPEVSVTTLTSVANSKVIPTENALMQNYPNPFNPSTVISYSLFTESKVRVVVYNSLGQLVSELVNRTQPGGYYEEVFDAGSLPSGIYIYSISAQSSDGKNNYTATRKMILVK